MSKSDEIKELKRRIDDLERRQFTDAISTNKVEQRQETCLWDSMPETPLGSGIKIGLLSCPCPKCSPRC